MSNSFFEHINKMYKKQTYLDKYGDSVVGTGFILFVFFLVFMYFYLKINLEPIKANWNSEKCKPHIIPFAGIINPAPNKSSTQTTKDNFNYCINGILEEVAQVFLKPIQYSLNVSSSNLKNITGSVNNIRKVVSYFRNQISSITQVVMGRFLNVMMPLRFSLIKLKSIFQKVEGILVSSLFTVLGSYYALKSFLGAFIQMLLIFLGILAGMIVLMWIFPWTWPSAIAASAFFALLAIPLAIVIVYLQHIVDISKPKSKPSCFDKNTIIQTKNGPSKISNLKTGVVLENGEVVTSFFKLDSNIDMYNFRNIIVSGDHRVIDDNNYIYIREHPEAELIENYNEPYIYCINTSSKKIIVNNIVFLDWDDMTPEEDKIVKEALIERENTNNYDNLNGGFVKDTKIELQNGTTKNIQDIEVGDILVNNIQVYGCVRVKNLPTKIFKLNNKTFIGGPNIQGYELSLGDFTTLQIENNDYEYKEDLYHLLTDKDYFMINNIKFYDYNSCLDKFLNNPKKYYYTNKNIIF